MGILIDSKIIIAVVIVIAVAAYVGFYFLREAVREWRKRRARKVLAPELAKLQGRISALERYEKIVVAVRDGAVVMCPTLLNGITDMLPDPNKIFTTEEEKQTILQGHGVELAIPGHEVILFDLKFTLDKRDFSSAAEDRGLTVSVRPTGQTLRFKLDLQTRSERIGGVDVEVQSYYWDLSFSGIRLISDEGFVRIVEFAQASRVVDDALGMPSAIPQRGLNNRRIF